MKLQRSEKNLRMGDFNFYVTTNIYTYHPISKIKFSPVMKKLNY